VARSSTRAANGIRGFRHLALLERPGVDRGALAHHVEHARLAELPGRPLVQPLEARNDHGVVQHPAETLLVVDVALHVEVERIAVRQHTPEGEEGTGHPEQRDRPAPVEQKTLVDGPPPTRCRAAKRRAARVRRGAPASA
jgi:hypothetical protein